MEKVKIKDIKTGAIKEVKKSLAGDYVGTGKFILVEDKKLEPKQKFNFIKEEKNVKYKYKYSRFIQTSKTN